MDGGGRELHEGVETPDEESVAATTTAHRREYCRVVGGLVGVASTAGCVTFGGEKSTRTVDPALRGTPEPSDPFDEQTTVAGQTWLPHTGERVVTLSAREGEDHFESYEPTTLDSTGSFAVPESTRLSGGTAELLIAVRSGETNSPEPSEGNGYTTVGREYPDGAVRWEYHGFLDSLWQTTPDVFRVNPRGEAGETLVRLDLTRGEERWRLDTDRTLRAWDGSVALLYDTATGANHCYDLETGDRLWQTTFPNPETAPSRPTEIRAGDAFVAAGNRRVDVLDAKTGFHRYRHPTSIDPYWSVHTDERVLFGAERLGNNTDSRLVALHVQDGHQWTIRESIDAIRPIAVGEVVFAVGKTTDGLFTLGIDPADGDIRWRTPGVVVTTDPQTAYVVGSGRVAAVGADGTVGA